MDKLKPILTHKFWILLIVALALPVVGWWSATAALVADIDTRWSALDTALTGVPKGAGAPNEQWSTRLNEINETRRKQNELAETQLWESQQELMVWPRSVAERIVGCPFRARPETVAGVLAYVPEAYKEAYRDEIRNLWLIVDPMVDEKGGNLVESAAKQKVRFAMGAIPQVSSTQWANLAPTWIEMWDAQEDVWLVKELLSAVARVNEGTLSIADSHVKSVDTLQLFGGRRADSAGGTTATVSSPTGSMDADDMEGEYAESMPPSFGGGGRSPLFGDATGATTNSADFPLSEEFDINVAAEDPTAASTVESSAPSGSPFGNTSTRRSASRKLQRYIDFDSARPFRERGFKLRVIMDHRRLPDLLVELTNSRWPVTIVRAHQFIDSAGKLSAFAASSMGSASYGSPGSSRFDEGDQDYDESEYAASMEEEQSAMDESMGSMSSMSSMPSGPSGLRVGSDLKVGIDTTHLAEVVIVGVLTLYNPPGVGAVDPGAAEAQPAAVPAESEATATGADAATKTPDTGAEAASPKPETEATPDTGAVEAGAGQTAPMEADNQSPESPQDPKTEGSEPAETKPETKEPASDSAATKNSDTDQPPAATEPKTN